MKPTAASVPWKLTGLLLAGASLLLSSGCSTTPTPTQLPSLPSKPSVNMPRKSSEILLSAEQKLQHWQTRQQQRLMQLMRSATPGPASPSGTVQPAPGAQHPKE